MPVRNVAAIAGAALAAVLVFLYFRSGADEAAAVKARLNAFADEVNASTTDGKGMEARALQLGSYFTDDVEIDLGQGAVPIRGKMTVLGMATRLQPRTAAFRIRFEDVTVVVAPDGASADVHLTAEFIRRSISTGEESLDAREFTLVMPRVDGEWKIGKVTAIEVLKQQ